MGAPACTQRMASTSRPLFTAVVLATIFITVVSCEDRARDLQGAEDWTYVVSGEDVALVSLANSDAQGLMACIVQYTGTLSIPGDQDLVAHLPTSSATSGALLLFSLGSDAHSDPVLLWAAGVQTPRTVHDVFLSDIEFVNSEEAEGELLLVKGVTTADSLYFIDATEYQSKLSIVAGDLGVFMAALAVNTGEYTWVSRLPCPCGESLTDCTAVTDEDSEIAIDGTLLAVTSMLRDRTTSILQAYVLIYELPPFPFRMPTLADSQAEGSLDVLLLNVVREYRIDTDDRSVDFRFKGIEVNTAEREVYVSGFISGTGNAILYDFEGSVATTLPSGGDTATEFVLQFSALNVAENPPAPFVASSRPGKSSFEALDVDDQILWVLYGSQTDVQGGARAYHVSATFSEVDGPIPYFHSITGDPVVLNSLVLDAVGSPVISGVTGGTLVVGDDTDPNQTVIAAALDDTIAFIARFNADGSLAVVLYSIQPAAMVHVAAAVNGAVFTAISQSSESTSAVLGRVFDCSVDCDALGYCSLGFPASSCACLRDARSAQGHCYPQPCPNECSGHGECSQMLLECVCNDGYAAPDCSRPIARRPLEEYLTMTVTSLGNPYSRQAGRITIDDMCSLPDVDWNYVVGSYTGAVTFGDLSHDRISVAHTTSEGEVCGFIAMYDEEMSLQQLVTVCSLTPGGRSGLDRCAVHKRTAGVYAAGRIGGTVTVDTLRITDEEGEVSSFPTNQEPDNSPQFVVTMEYTGSAGWCTVIPPCQAGGTACVWEDQPAIIDIDGDTMVLMAYALKHLSEHAADREGIVATVFNLSGDDPVVQDSGMISDASWTDGGGVLQDVVIWNGSIHILGTFPQQIYMKSLFTTSAADVTIPKPNHSSYALLLVKYNFQLDFLGYVNPNSLGSSHNVTAVSLATNDRRSILWAAFERSTYNMIDLGCFVVTEEMAMGPLFSISATDEVALGYNEAIDIEVDQAGELLLLTRLTGECQVSKGEDGVVPTSLEVSFTSVGNSYALVKSNIEAEPMWVVEPQPRVPFPGLADDYQGTVLSRIYVDEAGRLRLLGGIEQYEDGLGNSVGVVASLSGSYCGDCSNSGWCYLDDTAHGLCMCDPVAFGGQCEYSLKLRFEDIATWASQVALTDGYSDLDQVIFSDVVADTTSGIDQVYVAGSINGAAAFAPFLQENPTIQAATRNRHSGDGFLASYRPADGFLLWASFLSCDGEGDCVVTLSSVEINEVNGDVYVGGWSDGGTLKAYAPSANIEAAEPDVTMPIPPSGAAFVAVFKIVSGAWGWIYPMLPYSSSSNALSSCYYTACVAPDEPLTDSERTVDIAVLVDSQSGPVHIAVTGTYQRATTPYSYDAFVEVLQQAFFHSNPTPESTTTINSPQGTGFRGGRAVTFVGADVVAVGVWSPPRAEFHTAAHSRLLESTFDDTSVLFRWSARMTSNAILWAKSSPTDAVSFVMTSEVYDCAVTSRGDELWVTVNEPRLRVTGGDVTTDILSTQIGSFTISTLSGTDGYYEAYSTPLDVGTMQSPLDVRFRTTALDAKDYLVSGGQQKVGTWYSPDGYIPQLLLDTATDSTVAVLGSWDDYGNPRFLMHSTYGISDITAATYAPDGTLYVAGTTLGSSFFDSFYVDRPAAFVFRLSPCEANCNGNGVCVFGMFGRGAECICNEGWSDDTCSTPHCSGVSVCNDKGTCVGHNVCECEHGWGAPTCENCSNGFAPPNCDSCSGDLVWPECTECSNPNKQAPSCTGCIGGWVPPTCTTCGPGFVEPECEVCKNGFAPPNCQDCLDGYHRVGDTCVSDCDNPQFAPPDCNECIAGFALPDCRCPIGYTGATCQDFTCTEVSDCYLGECIGPNECFCVSGWSGEACQSPPDFSKIAVIIASPADHQVVMSSNEVIVLDASPTYNIISPTATVHFEWTCIDTSNPVVACPVVSSSGPVQVIPAGSLRMDSAYVWRITASSNGETASDTVSVTSSAMQGPSISVTVLPDGPLYSPADIILTAISTEDVQDFYWQIIEGDGSVDFSQVSSAPRGSVLHVFPQSIIGAATIYVQASSLSTGISSSELVSIDVTYAPEGYCIVAPTSGYALTSEFSLTCASWSSHSGHTTTYRWSYFTEEGLQVFVSSATTDTTARVRLPAGHLPLLATISRGENMDTFAASATIGEYSAGNVMAEEEAQLLLSSVAFVAEHWPNLGDDSDSLGLIEAMNTLSLFASLAGSSEELPSFGEVLDVAEQFRENLFIEITDSTVGQLLSIYSSLANNDGAARDDLATVAHALADLVDQLRAGPSVGTSLVSGQALFSPQQVVISSLDPLIASLSNDSASESIRGSVRDAISSTHLSLASFLACGQVSTTLVSTELIISVEKGSKAAFEQVTSERLSSSTANFAFTSGALNSIPFENSCTAWALGSYPAILYPGTGEGYEGSDICYSRITDLSLYSTTEQRLEVSFDAPNYVFIHFPSYPQCLQSTAAAECLFFDPRLGQWSDVGCELDSKSATAVVCKCTHLTEFAVGFNSSFVNVPPTASSGHGSDSVTASLASTTTQDASSDSLESSESSHSSESKSPLSKDSGGSTTWIIVLASLLAAACFLSVVLGMALVGIRARSELAKQKRAKEKTEGDEGGFSYEMNELRLDDLDVYADGHSEASSARSQALEEETEGSKGLLPRLWSAARRQRRKIISNGAATVPHTDVFAVEDSDEEDGEDSLFEKDREAKDLSRYEFTGKKKKRGALRGIQVPDHEREDEGLFTSGFDDILLSDGEEESATDESVDDELALALASAESSFPVPQASKRQRPSGLRSGVALQADVGEGIYVANPTEDDHEGTSRLVLDADCSVFSEDEFEE